MSGEREINEALKILRRASVATVYSLLGDFRSRYLLLGIKPLMLDMKVVGPALTIQYVSHEQALRENVKGNAIYDAYDLIRGGEVIVAASLSRSDVGVFGDCVTFSFKCKGASGVVVDGGVRDSPYLTKLRFPVFAKGTTPEHIGNQITPYKVNVAITCAGVYIEPEDVIMGDMDGAIVIPKWRVKEVALKAEEVEEKEEAIREMISSGIPLRDSYPPRPDLLEKFLKKKD